jgi:fumarate hydratase class I
MDQWPDISWEPGESVRRVNLDTVTREEIHTWKPGETLLLSGTMLTGRDAAHKRMTQMLEQGEPLAGGFGGQVYLLRGSG